eukprot:PhF_6_TR21199/c0_g4_i2/m.30593
MEQGLCPPAVQAPNQGFASLPPDLVNVFQAMQQQTIHMAMQQIFQKMDEDRATLRQQIDDSINTRVLMMQEDLDAKFAAIPTAAPVFTGILPEHFLQPRKWTTATLARMDRTAFRSVWKTEIIEPRLKKCVGSPGITRDLEEVSNGFAAVLRSVEAYFVKHPNRSPVMDEIFWDTAATIFEDICVEKIAQIDVLMDGGVKAANFFAANSHKAKPNDAIEKRKTTYLKGKDYLDKY